MNIEDKIEKIFKEIRDIRRDIHKHPELGQEEYRTSKIIRDFLNRNKIENHACAKTGVVGIIRGKNNGNTVGVRADIDALPIEEETDLEYKSIHKGIMHACGHDAHTAILLGVGKVLKEIENSLSGNVKLFFQPAEESVGGALPMIQEGCMENPKVDYVLGLHVFPSMETGFIGVKYDKMNASTDEFKITVKGVSGHGAYPHSGIDAIVLAGHVITGIQSYISRSISPLNSVVFSIGTINGGKGGNIIADKVEMIGTMRTLDEEQRIETKEKVKKLIENLCNAYGGVGNIEFDEGYKALINNNDVVRIIEKKGKEILGENKVIIGNNPSMGAEDFSYFAYKAKGGFYSLGCGNKEKGIVYNGHHPKFQIDEDCLKVGMRLQIENILELTKL
ncbi:MAG: M20 family metallopeptidase [Bacillota bacterium]|nr:M20 family metallopeptidase [Bacillota bacterium]